MNELQALKIISGEDKEKQKKQARNIDMRKRKALSTLFQTLHKIGEYYNNRRVHSLRMFQVLCITFTLYIMYCDVFASQLFVHLNKGAGRSLYRLFSTLNNFIDLPPLLPIHRYRQYAAHIHLLLRSGY